MNSLDAVATVKAYRSVVDELREAELAKALKQLQTGNEPGDVLNQLARNLCNKLMHTPTAQLRKASASGNFDVINTFQTLFDLDVGEPKSPAESSEDQNSETP